MEPIIEVKKISKKFVIQHEREKSLKKTVLSFHKKKTYETFYALRNVSFRISKGEFVGIIGKNGSGKSTLLKILADIYRPDSGKVIVRERISPFLELGVGFNGELSGKDNIYLYGAVLGLSKEEIDKKYTEIIEFSELEKFVDTKLKNYSSGMQVRLAFSIAIQAEAPILLVDEVLAVGDANFQKKCFEVFGKFKKEKKTVIYVSHDLETIERWCDKSILLDKGYVKVIGKSSKVIKYYEQKILRKETKLLIKKKKKTQMPNKECCIDTPGKPDMKKGKETTNPFKKENYGTKEINITKVSIKAGKKLYLKIHYGNPRKIKSAIFGCMIKNEQGTIIYGTNTQQLGLLIQLKLKGSVEFILEKNMLQKGRYFVNVSVANGDTCEYYDRHVNYYQFTVKDEKNFIGAVDLKSEVMIKDGK